jgi:hypothetical protein
MLLRIQRGLLRPGWKKGQCLTVSELESATIPVVAHRAKNAGSGAKAS